MSVDRLSGPGAQSMITARRIALGLTGAVVLMSLLGNPLLDVVELKTYDMRLRASGERAARDVAIAAIDEKSLARLGRWPWSRRTLAAVVDRLDALGARVIALDVFFPESENRKLLEHIERLESERGLSGEDTPFAPLKRTLAADAALGEAIARSGKVVLSMVFLSETEARQAPASDMTAVLEDLKAQAIGVIRGSGSGRLDFPMREPAGLLADVAEVRRAGRFTGHINGIPDVDGALRRAPLVVRYQGHFFPSADVQAARAFLHSPDLVLHTADSGVTGLGLGERVIGTDAEGHALIHYYGPEQTISTFSIADLLDGRIDAPMVKDRVVLVGPTAEGIGDIRVTPYGPTFPGVEIRANTIQNLIDGGFVNRPNWVRWLDVIVLLALGAGLSWLFPRTGMWGGGGLALGLVALYTVLAVVLFRTQLVWFNVVYPAVLILVLFMSATIAKYVVAETGKRQIKSAFQHYVAPKVVDEIIENVDRLRLGGEKRTLTVLFSDIRGFTSVAQSLEPDELVRLLNVYLTQMTEKVFRHDGLLDKYIGDAIMAVFGAPIPRADHALAACRTALDMVEELRTLQREWREQGLPVLDIGIGINTGSMIVGNMGSRDRFDYTVIGDAVNLGSRIEGLNKLYGTRILLSEFTYAQVHEHFAALREVDLAQVRGRRDPVRIYELLPADGTLDWLPEFTRAYELMRGQRYIEAALVFEHLWEAVHDPLSHYHLQQCRAGVARSA